MKQKRFFFLNSKWPTQKSRVFQLPPKAEQLLPKFYRLVLGLVGLIDAKGINMTQVYGRQAVQRKPKIWLKLTFFVFLPLFGAYIGQPDSQIG